MQLSMLIYWPKKFHALIALLNSFRKQLAVQLCKVSSYPVTPANIGRPSLPVTPEHFLEKYFPDKLSKKTRCVFKVCVMHGKNDNSSP